MLLLIIFLFLLLAVFLESSNYGLKDNLFVVSVIALSCYLFFKYGQGIDYFNYIYAIKSSNEAVLDFFKYGQFSNRFEIGFSMLSYIFLSIFKVNAELLISLFSLAAFLPIALFIRKYSNKPNLALLFYFSFFFLIYPFSGIRQGACVAIFAFWLLPFLYEKKMVNYYLGVLLLILIHNSAILLLILPFIKIVKFEGKSTLIYLVISLVVGTALVPMLLTKIFPSFGAAGELAKGYSEKEGSGFDILSLLIRLIIYLPIYFYYFKAKFFKIPFMEFIFKIYTISLIIYLLFSFNSLLSSRFTIYFRIVEPILLTNVVLVNKYRNTLFLRRVFILGLSIIMYIKSVQTEMFLGEYKKSLKFYEMPYVTIFDKKEILKYRNINSSLYQYVD